MAYASYDYYRTVYHGTVIAAPDASRLLQRASAWLDYFTIGRAAENPDLEELKMACCAIAEQYQTIDSAQSYAARSMHAAMEDGDAARLQSQSVGSWSKSYRSAGESAREASSYAREAETSLSAIARQYLGNTGLLYRGRRGCGTCSHML